MLFILSEWDVVPTGMECILPLLPLHPPLSLCKKHDRSNSSSLTSGFPTGHRTGLSRAPWESCCSTTAFFIHYNKISFVLQATKAARGGHSHRLYSHNCDRSRSTVKASQKCANDSQSVLRNTVNSRSQCETSGCICTSSKSID